MLYTNDGLSFYQGDLLAGDREATLLEIQSFNEKELLKASIIEARKYLADTDFKMTTDYDEDTTAIRVKRAECRLLIRTNVGAF